MHAGVRQERPGSCPKCGMALEAVTLEAPAKRTEYTCPMHPEIVRDAPGSCPICGMALEPQTVTGDEANEELISMTRRFKIGLVLTIPLLLLAMSDLIPGQPVQHAISGSFLQLIQLVLATPVVLWGGWPFFQRGWASIVNRSLNMFTLIAIGTAVAYGTGGFIMKAERVGSETLLAQIVRMVSEAQRSRAPIQRLADIVSSYFVPAVIVSAVITFIVWSVVGPEPRFAHAIVNAVAVLIIACPCALGRPCRSW